MKRKTLILCRTEFTGERKVGLDTGILVCLVEELGAYSQQAYESIFSKDGLFYTHRRCLIEAVNVLVNKKGMDGDKAKTAVMKLININKITIIEKDTSNANLAWQIYKKHEKLGIHPSDCFIIADWKKQGINKAHSVDGHFIKVCKAEEIDAELFYHIEDVDVKKRLSTFFRTTYRHKST